MQNWMRVWKRATATALAAASVLAGGLRAQGPVQLASPDGRNEVTVEVHDGGLYYSVTHEGKDVMTPSRLGFVFRNMPPLRDSLRIDGVARDSLDETWTQPWGQVARVRNHYNEARVTVRETASPKRHFDVVFRAFDDGVAFRYDVPEQPGFDAYEMMHELTEFAFALDGHAWWIPAGLWNRYEFLYSESPVSRLPMVHTPLTVEMQNGVDVVLHEANLVDYAAMNLEGTNTRTLHASLAPWADSVKVRGDAPLVSPWRTIEMADRVEDLEPSVLALNLNPPSRIQDTSWIKPMKYIGIWWGMHIGVNTWSEGPKHGATTQRMERYIDFAAANGFGGVLAEGWNKGWNGDWIANADSFSFTQPYPDYDLPAIAKYAQEKGVQVIAHNETSMGIKNYERQLEDAYTLYEKLGIHAIKTGYVGDKTKEGNAHHGQYMVRHWRKVIEAAARHHIMLDVHEPIKDTGERRTWPNMMTREGARGQEYNAWGGEGGNPPEHETILFWTRLHSGPMDYTPGIFDVFIQSANGTPRTPEESRVRTTVAKQLADYVVIFSPLQMAADLLKNYEGNPAFQFIKDVPVNWERTKVLKGKIGDYVIVARQERGGPDWYLGAITDEDARTFQVPLDFLDPGKKYEAQIYADGPGADWLTNPLPVSITRQDVDSTTTLTLKLAPGGGTAIRFRAR